MAESAKRSSLEQEEEEQDGNPHTTSYEVDNTRLPPEYRQNTAISLTEAQILALTGQMSNSSLIGADDDLETCVENETEGKPSPPECRQNTAISLTEAQILALTGQMSNSSLIGADDDLETCVENENTNNSQMESMESSHRYIQNRHKQLRYDAIVRNSDIVEDENENDTKISDDHLYARRRKQQQLREYKRDSKLPGNKLLSQSEQLQGYEYDSKLLGTQSAITSSHHPQMKDSNGGVFPPYTASIPRIDVSIYSDSSELLSSPGAYDIRGSNSPSCFLSYEAEVSDHDHDTTFNVDDEDIPSTSSSNCIVDGNDGGNIRSSRSDGGGSGGLPHAIALESELASEYDTVKKERDSLRTKLREVENSLQRRINATEHNADTANSVEATYAVHVVPISTEEEQQENDGKNTASSLNINDKISSSSSISSSKLGRNRLYGKMKFFILLMVTLIVLIILVPSRNINVNDNSDSNNIKNHGDNSNNNLTNIFSPSTNNLIKTKPILQSVKERGFIRCRSFGLAIRQGGGITVDLCRAVAAAIFDDPYNASNHTQFLRIPFGEQFTAIWNGTIDLVSAITIYNMERDVYEPSTGLGMAFSDPFVYTGIRFSGIPFYVDCADRFDSLTGVCRRLSVCVVTRTATIDFVKTMLPGVTIKGEIDDENMFASFRDGTCNVIAFDSFEKHDGFLEGYEGEYVHGSKLHSIEPRVLTTRGDDQEWADFCNWILRALITAEALNITQEIALSDSLWRSATTTSGNEFPETTSAFGAEYKNMFRSAIAAVGHYGEMYERNSKYLMPRESGRINTINLGNSGLLYSYPFGNLVVGDSSKSLNLPPPGPITDGALESIVDRGVLRCGVIGNRPGFASLQNVEDSDSQPADSISSFQNRTRWAGLDIEFCRAVAAAIFPETFLDAFDGIVGLVIVDVGNNVEAAYVALDNNDIDVFAGGSLSLMADVRERVTGKGFTFSPPYFYYDSTFCEGDTTSRISIRSNNTKEIGRSMVTPDTDPQWSAFVRWITIAIFYAEQHGITQSDALQMPVVELFGSDYKQMFRDAVLVVGNYDELFNRSLAYPFNISRACRNTVNRDGTSQMVAMNLH